MAKHIFSFVLALLLVVASLTACGIDKEPATTTIAIESAESSTSNVEDCQSDETRPSPTIEDQSCLTTELLAELTWEELLSSSWSPMTCEDQCIIDTIARLEEMGKVFSNTVGYCIRTQVENFPSIFDKDRMEEKLYLLLNAFNASDHTYWTAKIMASYNINFATGDPTEIVVDLTLCEFVDIKHPVWFIGDLVVITRNSTPPASSTEGFGFGSRLEVAEENPNPVNIGDVMLVSGFSYLTEMGEVLHDEVVTPYEYCWGCETCEDRDDCVNCTDCEPFEYLGAAVPRKTDEPFYMVQLCPLDGSEPYWFMPDTFVPLSAICAEDLNEEQLQNLAEKFPDIGYLLRQDSPVPP